MTNYKTLANHLMNELKNNSEYSETKKELLIHFGFNPVDTVDFMEYFTNQFNGDYEAIVGDDVAYPRLLKYLPEYIKLLTDDEIKRMNTYITNPTADNLRIVSHKLADGHEIKVDHYKEVRKERYTALNQNEWAVKGENLKDKRIQLGISLAEMSRKMGTAASRIRNFENGEGVMMAKSLEVFYETILELEEKEQRLRVYETTINNDPLVSDEFMSALKCTIELEQEMNFNITWEEIILNEMISLSDMDDDDDDEEMEERLYPTDTEIFGSEGDLQVDGN